MRAVEQTGQFERDYRREAEGRHRATLGAEFAPMLEELADDRPLAARYRDHALTSTWRDHRDCHAQPDLVLIYRLPNDDTLQFVRLGSHSELGI